MRNEPDHRYRIGAVERALKIVDAIADAGELSLGDLSANLAIPKGTLVRHLRVLESAGYLTVAAGTKLYRLGPALIYLGYAARRGLRIRDIALPGMRWLRERYDETVHLGILSTSDVVHVAVLPSTQPLKMAVPVGDRAGAHASALGKALLAWADEDAVSTVLAERGLRALTERTITSREALLRELSLVRRQGYAVDNEEIADGLRCVGAPVRDETNAVVAAISVSGPGSRISHRRTKAIAPSVVLVADRISSQLGWQGNGSGRDPCGPSALPALELEAVLANSAASSIEV